MPVINSKHLDDAPTDDAETKEDGKKKAGALGTELEILRLKLSNMEPDDKDLPELVARRRQLEKQLRIAKLTKKLELLLNDDDDTEDDYMGMF